METGTLVVRDFDFGGTTDYVIRDPGPRGLDTRVRSETRPRILGGAAAGYDVPNNGEVQIPLLVTGDDSRTAAMVLRAAFRAMRSGEEELQLSGVLDGEPVSLFGRPAGVDVDLSWPDDVLALARFALLDPLLYGAPVVEALDASSPTTVTADGNTDTDRITLTIAGNGGTPDVTWVPAALDELGTLAFVDALAPGDSYVVDVRSRVVTLDGDPVPGSVNPASQWFRFEPGANTLTWSGAASVQVTYRPAYA